MALSGHVNKKDDEQTEKVVVPRYTQSNAVDPFNQERLHEIWPELAIRFKEQIHLHNLLQSKPELLDNYVVKIDVENSVQDEALRQAKPEIIGFLRRTLNNAKIEVKVNLNRAKNNKKILTDEQKLQSMFKKNPAFALFKNKFDLDFNG